MLPRLTTEVAWFWRTVTPGERRVARWFGWLSMFVVAGLTTTGVWQFFSHEPDPDWFRYTTESKLRFSSKPSTGGAELHGLLGDAAFVLALFGGAWFAYKILFRVPKFAVFAAFVAFAANITGSVVRFNAVKIDGRALNQADDGYLQLFTSNMDFMVNGRQELGPATAQFLTFGHIVTVPVLLIAAWFTLMRARQAREREQSATGRPSSA
ncbi:hypothetical protein OAM92_01435 [Acidimicrobiales bacterium]|jgi:hypothetical protein|nr:hypothetical protein [Acidimicrobiales bacterium]